MPLDPSNLPEVVQVAFFLFGLLEDVWEGMSGTYLGKKWGSIEYLFNLYEIGEPRTMLYILKMYEGIVVAHRAEESERKRKADERKSSAGGGKNFTHNVKG
jgi:hypothetical protein|tara:strand:- start:281 stop:583 length:303 start_codon:yes stop_codon:yes gene_type:complete